MEAMTWPEIQDAMSNGYDTVIIPVGAIEQHGPHLAEGTDSFMGQADGLALAGLLGTALVAPVIRPGISPHHMAFPGTITLRPQTLTMLLEDYVDSYVRHGFKSFYIFCSHGGNYDTVAAALPQLRQRHPACRFFDEPPLLELLAGNNAVGGVDGISPQRIGAHAGDSETSQMLANFPDMVRMDQAVPGWIGTFDDDAKQQLFTNGMKGLSGIGVLGDPTAATAERGRRYIQAKAELMATWIQDNIRQPAPAG
jgi:creatinine amidohydrolase